MSPDEESMFEEFRDELEQALQADLDSQYYENLNHIEDFDYGVSMTPEEWDEYEASLEQEKKDYEEFLRNEEIALEEEALTIQQEETERKLAEARAQVEAAEKEQAEQDRKLQEHARKIEEMMRSRSVAILETLWEDIRAKKILPKTRYYCTDKECAKKTNSFSDECRACFVENYIKKFAPLPIVEDINTDSDNEETTDDSKELPEQ